MDCAALISAVPVSRSLHTVYSIAMQFNELFGHTVLSWEHLLSRADWWSISVSSSAHSAVARINAYAQGRGMKAWPRCVLT
jgi:hypothetical protein